MPLPLNRHDSTLAIAADVAGFIMEEAMPVDSRTDGSLAADVSTWIDGAAEEYRIAHISGHPVSDKTEKKVIALLDEIMGWSELQIDAALGPGGRGPFNKGGVRVLSGVGAKVTAVSDLIPELMAGRGSIEAINPRVLENIFLQPKSASDADIEGDFFFLLRHIRDDLGPKAAIEHLAEMISYFKSGAFREDFPPAFLKEWKVDVSEAAPESRKALVAEMRDQVVKRSAARCPSARVVIIEHEGQRVWRVDFGSASEAKMGNAIAPPGFVDRIMFTREGINVLFASARGDMGQGNFEDQVGRHLGALCQAIRSGTIEGATVPSAIINDVLFVIKAPKNKEERRHLKSLDEKGVHPDLLTFLTKISPVVADPKWGIDNETLSRISFVSVLGKGGRSGCFCLGRIGSVVADEMEALIRHPDVFVKDETIGVNVSKLISLLKDPGELAITKTDAGRLAAVMAAFAEKGDTAPEWWPTPRSCEKAAKALLEYQRDHKSLRDEAVVGRNKRIIGVVAARKSVQDSVDAQFGEFKSSIERKSEKKLGELLVESAQMMKAGSRRLMTPFHVLASRLYPSEFTDAVIQVEEEADRKTISARRTDVRVVFRDKSQLMEREEPDLLAQAKILDKIRHAKTRTVSASAYRIADLPVLASNVEAAPRQEIDGTPKTKAKTGAKKAAKDEI